MLNFAFNGADVPSFGAVAFRILSEYYSKIIFINSCSFIETSDMDGSNLYDYIFWDAYYKKLFHPNQSEQLKISTLRRKEFRTSRGLEMHLMNYFDSLFYFKNLWNWIGYHYFFTVLNRNATPHYFRAKKYFNDELFDHKGNAERMKRDKNYFQREINELKNLTSRMVDSGKKSMLSKQSSKLLHIYDNIFDQKYRSKILCVMIPEYNPSYLEKLTPSSQVAWKNIMNEAGKIVESLGYNQVRMAQLVPEDYFDLMHFLPSGGYKVADQITPQIQAVAKTNHYHVVPSPMKMHFITRKKTKKGFYDSFIKQ